MKGNLNLWLLVIVVVCALSFWFGRDLIGPSETSTGSGPGTELAAPEPTPDLNPVDPDGPTVHLLVLNGTPESGLAREFGLLLGRAGWVAADVGNAPHSRFEHSFLVNRQLSPVRAKQLAAELGGLPVLREFDGRSTADAVLVLGRDAPYLREHLKRRAGS